MKILKLVLYLLILSGAVTWVAMSDSRPAEFYTAEEKNTITENIRLYSNGKLIGEWKGIGRGSMDGDTYRFKTESGAFSRQIRISGDFVVETLPN